MFYERLHLECCVTVNYSLYKLQFLIFINKLQIKLTVSKSVLISRYSILVLYRYMLMIHSSLYSNPMTQRKRGKHLCTASPQLNTYMDREILMHIPPPHRNKDRMHN